MSLHLHAFWFLLLALANIMSAARWPPLQITADLLVLILLPWYLLAALRRVYGLDWKPTLIRGIATGATYAVALGVTISGLFLLTAA